MISIFILIGLVTFVFAIFVSMYYNYTATWNFLDSVGRFFHWYAQHFWK